MTTAQPSHNSASEIEALDRSRRHMLASVVITSTLWFLPQILQGLLPDSLPHTLKTVLILAGLAGAAAWMVCMWRYHQFQQKVQANPDLRERLDDERVTALRKEAILRGWGFLLVGLAIGVGLAPFTELPDLAVLMTLLLLGVNAPIVIFLILDRD